MVRLNGAIFRARDRQKQKYQALGRRDSSAKHVEALRSPPDGKTNTFESHPPADRLGRRQIAHAARGRSLSKREPAFDLGGTARAKKSQCGGGRVDDPCFGTEQRDANPIAAPLSRLLSGVEN